MQTNLMLFKATDCAQLRADLQTHVENKDFVHITSTTPVWVLDIIVKQIKKDIENSKPSSITFASKKLLEAMKFSKREEVNKLYVDLYLSSAVYKNPKNIVIITDTNNACRNDFPSSLVDRILTIEKVFRLKNNDHRVGVVYIPDDNLLCTTY